MGRLLTRGFCLLLLASTGCTAEGPQGPRTSNLPRIHHDAGALDSGLEFDAAVATDAAVDGNLGAFEAASPDADVREDDASSVFDAQALHDAAEGDGSLADAAQTEAGSDADASFESDAGFDGHLQDAGTADAGGAEPDASATCGYQGLVAGNDCPGVVSCQDNDGSLVLACTLREPGGSVVNRCCINGLGTGHNSCRTGGCGLLAEATCDGPEDCSGGKMCCRDWTGATSCELSCPAPDRLCHRNEDCPTGLRCRVGSGGTLYGYEWWGFCRSELSGE